MPNKGQGCGKGRGRGRGRGRGQLQPLHVPAIPGPSNRTYEEERQIINHSLAETKKRIKTLTPEARKVYVGKKRDRELERILLPDAPPQKKKRKQSPNRSECRLVIGTPKTPPPRKLMQWEIIDNEPIPGTTPVTSCLPVQIVDDMRTPSSDDAPIPGTTPTPSSCLPVQIPHDTRTPSTKNIDSIVEVPGYSPLRVDWTTGQLKNQSQVTPSLPKSSLAKNRAPKPKHGLTKITRPAEKQQVISGSDFGTKRADTVLEGWLIELEAESDVEEADDDEGGQLTSNDGPMNINSQAALLPPEMEEQAKEWLQNEDAEADRTLRDMLPIDHLTFDWSCDHAKFTGQREEFTASPGPTFDIDEDTTPLTVFRKFFDDDLLNLIVTQTNKYATEQTDTVTTKHSRLLKWTNTDKDEVQIFLAMIILQGLAPLNVEYDYWKENGYLTLKYFKTLMTYNRFVLLKRLLHFSDNKADRTGLSLDERKLRKIWPVLDFLNKKFSTLYIPGQNIAVDESLLKWHGRLAFAQKIATKAAKVGIKNYELCESDSGYLCSFFIYTGKEKSGQATNYNGQTDMTEDMTKDTTDSINDIQMTDIQQMTELVTDRQPTMASAHSSPPPPQNATAQIVQVLAKPLLGKGYTLVMDNFYNSPLLARYLKAQKTDCFGTLRVNREFVPETLKSLAKTEMRVGEAVQTFSRDLSVLMWRDTNVVSMISTFHRGEIGGKEKYGRYKFKPQVVLDYNLVMGGVDKKDQLLSAHPMERSRNQAWYKKVFRRLLNVTIQNAYIIFKSRNPAVTSRAFRQRLADEMIRECRPPHVQNILQVTPKLIIQRPGVQNRPILHGNHFIGEGASKNARCVWCLQSRSKYICKQCNVSLCLTVCFEEYHTKP